MVRPHAVWALFRLWGGEAQVFLAEVRELEDDEETLEEYRWWDDGLV
jgi:hypothetical protein